MNKKEHIVSLLFVAKEPLPMETISKILEEEERVILRWLFELEHEYKERGIRIRRVAGGFEMVTSDESFQYVEKLVPKQYETLSRSARETVTIIALQQPVNKATIARFRGVKNPDSGIEALLDRKLIRETEEGFVTTDEFLKFYGVNDLKELHEKLSLMSVSIPADEDEQPHE